MGECLISRRGGEAYKLPILNADYPQDASTFASEDRSLSFSVAIDEHGKPEAYTYQWYLNGQIIDGAIASNYTLMDLTVVGTKTIYCIVTNKAGSVVSREATITIKDPMPIGYTYTGAHKLIEQDDYNWYIQCTASGTLVLPRDMTVDVTILGGGGGGGGGNASVGGGGGGGYQTIKFGIDVTAGTEYPIVVGAGASRGLGNNGGGSSAFGFTASGGSGGGFGDSKSTYASGGAGGTGRGGSRGGNGASNTVRAFGESGTNWPLYGGGGAAGDSSPGSPYGGTRASNATGYGGGGGGSTGWSDYDESYGWGGAGGSGIVLIRNAR